MKNKFVFLFVILLLLTIGFGCSYIDQARELTNSNSNKSTVEKGVDTVQGEKKIGVKECDDFMDELEKSNKKDGEDFISEAARRVFVNELRDKLRKSIEENKKDPAKQAQECKEYKEQYDKWFKENNAANKKSAWYFKETEKIFNQIFGFFQWTFEVLQ